MRFSRVGPRVVTAMIWQQKQMRELLSAVTEALCSWDRIWTGWLVAQLHRLSFRLCACLADDCTSMALVRQDQSARNAERVWHGVSASKR